MEEAWRESHWEVSTAEWVSRSTHHTHQDRASVINWRNKRSRESCFQELFTSSPASELKIFWELVFEKWRLNETFEQKWDWEYFAAICELNGRLAFNETDDEWVMSTGLDNKSKRRRAESKSSLGWEFIESREKERDVCGIWPTLSYDLEQDIEGLVGLAKKEILVSSVDLVGIEFIENNDKVVVRWSREGHQTVEWMGAFHFDNS